jgi:acetyltransferase-like isoleucine patch superfamily enzyme
MVPTARSGEHLGPALVLARDLGCALVAMCSGAAAADDVAERASEIPGLAWAAVDVPEEYQHRLLKLETSQIEDARQGRHSDLSLKRNLGLLLARLTGWRSLLFLDDDIRGLDASTVRRGAAALRRGDAAGMAVPRFPDNSVVCHAHRIAGGRQDVFVGGSALVVDVPAAVAFFPDVYNEDWLFLYDSLARRRVVQYGRVEQLRYDPFADPARAVSEEFGDVIAEGLVGLLHHRGRTDLTEVDYWRLVLRGRQQLLDRVMGRLEQRPACRQARQALQSVQAAHGRLAEITATACSGYVSAWRADLAVWADRLAELRAAGSLSAALQYLDLSHVSHLSEETVMTAGRRIQGVHPTATVAPTAEVNARYRKLLEGEWERVGRPTSIGAGADVGHFCVVGQEVSIGARTVLDAYTLVEGGATIGSGTLLTHRASVGARARVGDGCVIGGFICERSVVGDRARVFGNLVHRQLDPSLPWDAPQAQEPSPSIGEGAFVGWGATVVGGVTIGAGAYVCAGATVTQDVPAGHIVHGINRVEPPDRWKGGLGRSPFLRARPLTALRSRLRRMPPWPAALPPEAVPPPGQLAGAGHATPVW